MSLRSLFHRSRTRRNAQRANHVRKTRRSRFEALENRCLLSLTPAVGYSVGTDPQAIVAADFNNDGRLDLATANTVGNTVSVLLGNANRTFGSAITSTAGSSSKSIAVGDFDNDGNLDLVVARSVLFGKGDGSFAEPSFPVNHDSLSVAVGDFNDDGTMDLAVTSLTFQTYYGYGYTYSTSTTEASVLLSNGDRTFTSQGIAFVDWNPTMTTVVTDFDGDDNLDLLVGVPGDYVRIMQGDGVGHLVRAGDQNWLIGDAGGLASMAVGDLNRDGIVDLVAQDRYNVTVRLGNGQGGFQPPPGGLNYAAGDGPRSVALADFDRNGALDIVVVNHGSKNISILLGAGDGTFSPPEHFAIGPGNSAAASADLNRDGVVDSADYIVWRKSGGTAEQYNAWRANFGKSVAPVSPIPVAVAAGDFNGDGWVDVATANGDGSVSVIYNNQSWPQVPPTFPSVSISDVTVTEGDSGTSTATFTLTLSSAAVVDLSVDYRTVDSSAVAGEDYIAKSGTVVIPAGQTSRTFDVSIVGDRNPEWTETFTVSLSASTHAPIQDGQGTCWINDNEPQISIDDVSMLEGTGNNTTTHFTFTVTLSTAYDQRVTVWYHTFNDTARTGNNDYNSKGGRLTFNPGETTKTITIVVKADNRKEDDETFFVALFGESLHSLLTKSSGIGTILNDD
jgi:hypothetical protein